MGKIWIIVAIVIVIVIALLVGIMAGPIMSNVEHPEYQVTSSVGNIEIRQYNPMLIAQVDVPGERKDAINQGFRLLADYIFGNNTVEKKIKMTAPVQQQSNTKIAMTAPVQQQESNGSWQISFVMPSEYTMDSLPKPNSKTVSIKEIPEQTYIVITFSGVNSNDNIAKHEKQLLKYISKHHIETIAVPKYAFYNPPWTLPLMRRNEIMIEINKNHNN